MGTSPPGFGEVGDSAVISAERLARSQSSYWRELAPRMEPFVRAMNLGINRFAPPIPTEVPSERRAFVAELGFALFRNRATTGARDWEGAVRQVTERIARLSGDPLSEIAWPSKTEHDQANKLADKLSEFAQKRGRAWKLTIDPEIPGCGIVDRAAADFMIHRRRRRIARRRAEEQELFEVKAVDRPFRSEDIRQLLMYAALLSSANKTPERIGLVNPRLGTFAEWSPDELAQDIAGVSGSQLLHQIVFDISEAGVSN